MGFFSKLRIVGLREVSPVTPPVMRVHMPAGAYVAAPGARSSGPQSDLRISNGLKEFLWHLDGLGRGTLLDLGPAWQTTISFFIERGFKVYAEDVLRAWKDFLTAEENRLRSVKLETDPTDLTPESRAARFLETNLQYPASSFDAVLLWDLLDFLEPALVKRTVAHLTDLIRPGGVLLAMFHSKKPEGFHRYRVVDTQTLQVLPTPILCPAQRVYQNREIQDLFRIYRTSKSFVGRDQLREVLFLK
jgi:hypothetical protein